MEEVQGSQYAVQIAFHTLRDRCKALQQHVVLLEEENVTLKIQCSKQDKSNHSLSEVDSLRTQVAELSEQKQQLQNKMKMITNENQELWSKLSKMTKMNKSLGGHLSKISDTLTQHTAVKTPQTQLVRSKTFTKPELQTKVLQKNLEENDKISLELEDISLKLSDSFSKQKKELDMLCSELSEMALVNEGLNTENCGFLLDEDLEIDVFSELQLCNNDLQDIKESTVHQKTLLELCLKNMSLLKGKLQCKSQDPKLEKSTSTGDLSKKTFEDKSVETQPINNNNISLSKTHGDYATNCDRICPLCSKVFKKDINFSVFQEHVEEHFVPDVQEFEIL